MSITASLYKVLESVSLNLRDSNVRTPAEKKQQKRRLRELEKLDKTHTKKHLSQANINKLAR